jgi:DNA-binding winged helix-turn-helix (wHTH) protein/tetratricopeptide (TPR) repeat protein
MDSTAARDRIFCFGQFEARVTTGKLLKQGREVKLQDQPFRLLVALLERPGRMVSRLELKEILWPRGIVEFDKSLDVAMTKLRQALGDDPGSPLFIETTPRRGYRFIAPYRLAEEPGYAPVTVVSPPGEAAPVVVESDPPPARWRKAAVGAAAVAVLAMVMGLALYGQSQHSRKLTERAAVLVGDIANLTGDASFDRALRTAATIDFAQSPYLTIVSDERIADSLQVLGRPPDDVLEPAILRQVCQQQRAAVAVHGSIKGTAPGYLLSLVASRCSDGSAIATVRSPAAAKDQVVGSLARAIVELRKQFGESSESLKQYDVTVVEGTTNSLEALKAYQLGMELRAHARNIDAIPAFKAAIALDPTFAIAYAQLGSCYSNQQESQLATQFFAKAFSLREHATEPERLYIAGRYFDVVTGEMEKGAGIYKLWTEIYPTDWRGFNALSNDANMLGRYGPAADAAGKAIALEPQHVYGYTNRAVALLGLNRFDAAAQVVHEANRRGLDGSVLHSVLFSTALVEGDEAALNLERAWSAAQPQEIDIPFVEGELAEARGRVRESGQLFAHLAERARGFGLSGYAQVILAQEALFDAQMGLRENALQHLRDLPAPVTDEFALELSALTYAWLGKGDKAQALQQQIDGQFPLSTYNVSVFGPTIRTALAMNTLRSGAEIFSLMSPVSSYEMGRQAVLIPTYVRAAALLQARSAAAAEAEFKKIIANRGVDAASPYYSLAHLGVARALVMQNRPADARKAYEVLFGLWKDADPDLPPLEKARIEYALLARQ